MKTIKAFVETGTDGTYNVYINEDLPFGFFGEGKTAEEAKEDFLESYKEMKELYEDESQKSTDYNFVFKYDAQSFLNYYCKIFSMPALERLTGINQKLLHHYASGLKKPREKQLSKIETALHNLGDELLAVQL